MFLLFLKTLTPFTTLKSQEAEKKLLRLLILFPSSRSAMRAALSANYKSAKPLITFGREDRR